MQYPQLTQICKADLVYRLLDLRWTVVADIAVVLLSGCGVGALVEPTPYTGKNSLACQHVKLKNPHNFVASARSDDHDDQKLISYADFRIHHRNLADVTGSVQSSDFDMKT